MNLLDNCFAALTIGRLFTRHRYGIEWGFWPREHALEGELRFHFHGTWTLRPPLMLIPYYGRIDLRPGVHCSAGWTGHRAEMVYLEFEYGWGWHRHRRCIWQSPKAWL